MTILSRNDQNGRSMIEMLGVLAIIGVLSVGGISGYSRAMAKYKLTKAQDQITMLLMNIRTAYATSPSYTGLSSQTAADYAIAPGDMIVSSTTTSGDSSTTSKSLAGAFGGAVDVSAVSGKEAYFYITMHNLAPEACRSLLTSDWGADGLVMIQAGTETTSGSGSGSSTSTAPAAADIPCSTSSGTKFCVQDLPVSLQSAATTCGTPGTYITWVYY